jgi:hypothetical protein
LLCIIWVWVNSIMVSVILGIPAACHFCYAICHFCYAMCHFALSVFFLNYLGQIYIMVGSFRLCFKRVGNLPLI